MFNGPANDAQAGTSITLFKEASDVHISGNTAINATVNNNTTVTNNRPLQGEHLAKTDPIRFLLEHTAPDALVDSGDRRDPPQCAPETRDEIHCQIKAWADSPVGKAMIFWLFGSAGAGKSAICQTIAEMFKRDGLLLL
ncbi:hypothetical protein CPB83DRAFT_895920 [Crepidotus variabilis]|uniref:Uncharacterized protein n=1 Tax=Crepidotus variabilis TaxID=179855 RepID=A0A9P6ECW8_9AGAR|nr:hypothetical protein CPB83DRAFT_895920 [Crepidotus variabilis]